MKKLMIAAAAICAAVVSYGAAVQWSAGTITDANGDTAGKDQVKGYLFQLAVDTYSDYAKMDADALSTALYNAYKDSLADAVTTGPSTKKGALILEGIDAAASVPVYAAVLYIDSTLGDSPYFMGNVATITWGGVGTPSVGELANAIGGSGAPTSWQTVPEPTTGLLMLLGMAGLALRRRRA